jgi:S-adenosylmethionine synthetase
LEKIARDCCEELGYDNEEKGLSFKTMSIITEVEMLNSSSDTLRNKGNSSRELVALKSTTVYGYATDEWDDQYLLPLDTYLSH